MSTLLLGLLDWFLDNIVSSSNFLESFCNLSANDEYMSDCEIAPTTANASTKAI